MHLKDSEIHGINSLNSKSFHMHLTLSESVKVYDLSMVAPEDSPNTDGLHISQSNNIDVYDSKFGTGDDCVSIGEGTTQLTVSGVTCGPGHGIRYILYIKYPSLFLRKKFVRI
jgi:galacturan 1,4-alpha-galacturonidase